MLTSEYKLVPAQHPRSWLAEAVWLSMLLLLLVLLVGGQGMSGSDRYFYDAIGQMTNYFMPAALAMLMAMRCGVIDLSVWMSWSAGSVVAACILHAALSGQGEGEVHAGYWPVLAFAASAAAGAAIGGLNALLVRVPKFPAVAATAVTALAVWLVLQVAAPAGRIDVHPRAFDAWHVSISQETPQAGSQEDSNTEPPPSKTALPLAITRMLFSAILFAVVMTFLMVAYSHLGHQEEKEIDFRTMPHARTAALVSGGFISALGGALWLLENSHATVPRLPVHDLRIPVAAVLAGGILLAGRGRTMLAAVSLPAAMLVATQWYVLGWDLNTHGMALHPLVLLAMAILASLSLRVFARRGGILATASAACSVLAVLVLAWSAVAETARLTDAGQWIAVALASAGAVLLKVTAVSGMRRSTDRATA